MLATSIGLLTLFSSLAQAYFIEPSNHFARREELTQCTSSHTTFQDSLDGWVLQTGSSEENYGFTSDGLEMKILPPSEYVPLFDKDEEFAYNKIEGQGFTFNATTYMRYGKFSAKVKSAKVPGAVTAIILIADDDDEIDFEILAGKRSITSNYFVSGHKEFGVNGQIIDPPEAAASEEFYEYGVDWNPERIVWTINGKTIRTERQDEAKNGLPKAAARVQIGLWDGSGAAGTARWARGPINWSEQKEPVTAYIKDVKIECDPQYNQIV